MSKNNKIFGAKLVLEYLQSGKSITKIWLSKTINQRVQEIEDLARKRKIPFSRLEKKELSKILGPEQNKSVVAEVSPVKIHDEKFLYENKLDTAKYLFAVNIEDPHNLGAMIRSVHAFGLDGIIFSNRNTSTLSDFVIRASAGAIFETNLIRVGNISNCIKKLKENNFWVYGTDVKSENSASIYETKFDQKSVILLGNEGKGLSPNVKKSCDFVIHIPCSFNSLNVSVATGIILSSVYQQNLMND